jgi:hypothetical protein
MSINQKKIIAVIGHLVRDRIRNLTGGYIEALGGIAYSLAALGMSASGRYNVRPVCRIGHDLLPMVESVFQKFSAIDLSAIKVISRTNKIHELVYKTADYREERNFGEMPEITPLLFKKLKIIDIALLNYIGGDEFKPGSIKWLKQKYRPLVYLDYHSLALGRAVLDKKNLRVKRYFRYNPHWREYVSLADIVQMNYPELKSIFSKTENENNSIIKSALEIKSAGPGTVIITREEKDLIVILDSKYKPDIHILPVRPVNKAIDPTGCGDSFAAGFIGSYIDDKDVLKACETGLDLAGKKAAFSGLDGFLKLGNG